MNRAARRRANRTGRDVLTAAAPDTRVWQVARIDDDVWEARRGDIVLASGVPRVDAVAALMADYTGECVTAAAAGFAPTGAEFVARFREGEETRDSGGFTRVIDQGAVAFDRPFPLPIMATTTTSWGHDGAELVGVILDATISSPDVEMRGRFDTSERAVEIARMVSEGVLTRHSPDLGSDVTDFECTEYEDDEWGGWCVSGTLHFIEATVLGTTILPFPALDSATIEIVGATTDDDTAGDPDAEGVTAAADAGSLLASARTVVLPAAPRRDQIESLLADAGVHAGRYPAAWFDDPQFAAPTAPHITPDGRYQGHLACWDTCHVGQPEGPDVCTTPPAAEDGYAGFHRLSVGLDNGTRIRVGGITIGTGHAGRYGLTPDDVTSHYDNTGTLAAVVRAGEDAHGIWVSGAVRPGLDDWTLWSLEVCALSGDWRRLTPGGPLTLMAALGVNVPGFPIPDVAAVVAAGECQTLIAAGARTMALVASAQRPTTPAAPAQFAAAQDLTRRIAQLEAQVAQVREWVTPTAVEQLRARIHPTT